MIQGEKGEYYWQGFSDSKPSEAIQPHEFPGIGVAAVFPFHPTDKNLKPTVRQYKSYKSQQKGDRARQLSEWLLAKNETGLELVGMFHAHDQETAAKLGIDLMEELPDTRVERHFEGFRLYFGDNWIDFAQAVALQYYLFTVEFGALRAGMKLPPDHRRIVLAMDRFPGPSPKSRDAGKRLPQTRGNAFISYVRANSATGKGIKSENDTVGLDCQFGNLDWWRENDSGKWKKGKDHPHFVLPDWAAAAAIAKEFPDEFASSFRSEKSGNDALEGLLELYDTFKKFTLWSMGRDLPLHIRAKSRIWQVPDDAKQYILERASAR